MNSAIFEEENYSVGFTDEPRFAEEPRFADEMTERRHRHRPPNLIVDVGSRLTPVYNNPYIASAPGAASGPGIRGQISRGHDAYMRKTQQLLEEIYNEEKEFKMNRRNSPSPTTPSTPMRKVYRNPVALCPRPRRQSSPDIAAAKAPQTTAKEMVAAAFEGLARSCPRGLHFSRIVSYVRNKFQLSPSVNQSLDNHVFKALNAMMLKGIVTQAYGMGPREGTFQLVRTADEAPGLNLTLRGHSVPNIVKAVKSGNALPGPISHLCRSSPTLNCPGRGELRRDSNFRAAAGGIGYEFRNRIPIREAPGEKSWPSSSSPVKLNLSSSCISFDRGGHDSRLASTSTRQYFQPSSGYGYGYGGSNARKNLNVNDPMLTKSFGARAGLCGSTSSMNAKNDDDFRVRQPPNSPFGGSEKSVSDFLDFADLAQII